jgi:ADP-ribose pyrophosphatase YjhB (NUDIX family)
LRELAEETGLAASGLAHFTDMVLGRFHLSVFSALAGEGDPVASDDAVAAAFFALDAILAMNATESTKQCARNLLGTLPLDSA